MKLLCLFKIDLWQKKYRIFCLKKVNFAHSISLEKQSNMYWFIVQYHSNWYFFFTKLLFLDGHKIGSRKHGYFLSNSEFYKIQNSWIDQNSPLLLLQFYYECAIKMWGAWRLEAVVEADGGYIEEMWIFYNLECQKKFFSLKKNSQITHNPVIAVQNRSETSAQPCRSYSIYWCTLYNT